MLEVLLRQPQPSLEESCSLSTITTSWVAGGFCCVGEEWLGGPIVWFRDMLKVTACWGCWFCPRRQPLPLAGPPQCHERSAVMVYRVSVPRVFFSWAPRGGPPLVFDESCSAQGFVEGSAGFVARDVKRSSMRLRRLFRSIATPFSEANHGGLCKDLCSNQSNQLFFLFDAQKSARSYSKQVKQDLLSKHQREVNKLNSYYNKQLESIKANHNKQLIMLQNQLKEATGRAHVLQANLDKAAVKHRQDITEKQKAHASVFAKQNATIQALERDQQDYLRMNFELVDEVDNAHKSAEDTVRDSVQQAAQSKRQAVLSA